MAKIIYTNMSELAVRGLERLAADRKLKVIAAPSGGFTVITEGRGADDAARAAAARRERMTASLG